MLLLVIVAKSDDLVRSPCSGGEESGFDPLFLFLVFFCREVYLLPGDLHAIHSWRRFCLDLVEDGEREKLTGNTARCARVPMYDTARLWGVDLLSGNSGKFPLLAV